MVTQGEFPGIWTRSDFADMIEDVVNDYGDIKVPDVVQFGGLPNEAFVIEPHAGGWRIFYSERGGRTGEVWFERESDAVDAFMEFLAADSSIRFVSG